MRVAEVTRLISRANGGVFFAQEGLLSQFSAQDCFPLDLGFFGARDSSTQIDTARLTGVRLEVFSHWGPANFAYSPGLLPALRSFKPELLHCHGLWHYPAWASYRYYRESGIPLLISPHGMLDPWALGFSKLKKRIAGVLFQTRQLEAAQALHALCPAEASAIASTGLECPILVIPNGVNLPPLRSKVRDKQTNTLLYLGRLHPKKGLEALVLAWGTLQLKKDIPDNWRLSLAGWDELGTEMRLKRLVKKMGLKGVSFLGPVWGEQKARVLAEAEASILPSLSEGLPMSILEAWANQQPVLMTEACNLEQGFSSGAALRIEPTPDSISKGILALVNTPEDKRIAMGKAGRCLVERLYSWPVVASSMLRVYQALANRTPLPSDLIYIP